MPKFQSPPQQPTTNNQQPTTNNQQPTINNNQSSCAKAPADRQTFLKPILLITLSIFSNIITASTDRNCSKRRECFQHNIQLQLCDSFGFPVVPATDSSFCTGGTDTRFWVTLDIIKDGPLVTINFPLINFQTGQVSVNNPTCPFGEELPGFPPPGGYLYTADGFLPEELRPSNLIPRSIVAASNNGLSPVFSFTQTPTSLPVPPVGYIVQVTNAGAVQVQCAGTFGNIIPPGPQVLMPCSITYLVSPKKKLCKNITISAGATNVTQFTNPRLLNDAIRDAHVNDAFGGKVAFTWVDNSMVTDKTNGTLNCMVAIGEIVNGQLKVGTPVQLTNLPAETMAWTTAIAINRINPDNIVVSYGLIDTVNDNPSPTGDGKTAFPCRAISNDGGKTWPEVFEYDAVFGTMALDGIMTVSSVYNGSLSVGQTIVPNFLASGGFAPNTVILSQLSGTPGGVGTYLVSNPQLIPTETLLVASPPLNGIISINAQDSGGFGDNLGVTADKFGNIWYNTTHTFFFNQPSFWASADGGVTFEEIYTAPIPPDAPADNNFFLDFPTSCFGGDGLGNYGFWYQYSFLNLDTGNTLASIGFIIINGLNDFGARTETRLPQFLGALGHMDLAASSDGRLWGQGPNDDWFTLPWTYVQPGGLMFKSPGLIDENYAGAWQWITYNDIVWNWGITNIVSLPSNGYKFKTSPQSIIYDENKDALYMIIAAQSPDYSQDMPLRFVISRDNGMTWSNPIDIRTTNFANSGYQSMALDPVTGDLVFGWHDGRNTDPDSPTAFQTLEYMAAVIPAKKLSELVNAIPLSNPTFEVPPATTPIV